MHLPRGSYETVAGLVLARLGRMAAEGDEVRAGPVLLRVTAMEGMRIREVQVRRPADPDGQEGQGGQDGDRDEGR